MKAGGLRAERLFETSIYGSDLKALERFYVDLFGLERIAGMGDRMVALRCGASALLLFDPEMTSQTGGMFPPHGSRAAAGKGHIAFAVPLEAFPAWRARLADHGVSIETEVEWPDGHRSIYFRDPAGNSVELAPPTIWDGLGYRAAGPVS